MDQQKIFLSNRTECLFQSFKKYLFAGSHPLSKRLIIVPSAAMKSWLIMQMAQDPEMTIAAGIEVGFLEPTIQKLGVCREPSELNLALALETTIIDLIHQFPDLEPSMQTHWKPLIDHVATHPKRITPLASSLAKYFLDYGRYGGEMLAQWKLDKNPGWQEMLWTSMVDLFSAWNFPYNKLSSFELGSDWEPEDLQIHLFGLSYLSPIHHRFFCQIADRVPVHYYLFSPCQQFWGDLLSDREGVRLKKYWMKQEVSDQQQTALENFLSDRNPLLANFGRLGREMFNQLESSQGAIYEHYALPAAILEDEAYTDLISPDLDLEISQHPLTLLQAIQSDIVLLRNPDDQKKVEFSGFDQTIQIHGAPKPAREVQVVYDIILSILDKHGPDSDHPIAPADIVIMASDPDVYSPYIRNTFGSPESCLSVSLIDGQPATERLLIKGFLQLIHLPFGRWEITSLVGLLGLTAFQKKHQFSLEDIDVIIAWIENADIRWGGDSEHRDELLQRDHCPRGMIEESWHGTWEHGLGILLEGIALKQQSPHLGGVFTPLDGVESTQCELFGKVLHLIRSLLVDLKPLSDGSSLSLKDWVNYLKCVFESYFSFDDDLEAVQLLHEHLDAFKPPIETNLDSHTFSFSSISYHLDLSLQRSSGSVKSSNFQSISFCSFLPMRAVPAKVIILMGMAEGLFPRSNQISSLNLMNHSPGCDYVPSQVDFDRYLFLESLLSARNYFIATYPSQSPGESQQQLPSLLLRELLNYIEKFSLEIAKECLVLHSLVPFHYSYFSPESHFKSYSYSHYLAALSHYQPHKEPIKSFLSTFTHLPSEFNKQDGIVDVTLNDLSRLVKNPLKDYCNRVLNLYLDSAESRRYQEHEDLLITPIHQSAIRKEGVCSEFKDVLKHAENSGKLPRGPFKGLEIERLQNEINEYCTHLQACGIDQSAMFSIEFNKRYSEPIYENSCWYLPPLTMRSDSFGQVCLTGRLERVSSGGLILLSDDKIEKAIEAWPELLILGSLVKAYSLPIATQIVFAKNGKIKELDFADPVTLLTHLLEYYFKCQHTISPLLPDWIKPILNGSVNDIEKKLFIATGDGFEPVYNEYLKWFARNSTELDIDATFANWQSTAKHLFVDMSKAWYG